MWFVAIFAPQTLFSQYANRLYDADSNSEFGYHIRFVNNDSALLLHGGANTPTGSGVLWTMRLDTNLDKTANTNFVYTPTRLYSARNGSMKRIPGGHFVVGVTAIAPSSAANFGVSSSICLLKLDEHGDSVFLKRLTDTALVYQDYAWDVIQMPDGGFLVAGQTIYPVQNAVCDAKLYRTDSMGNVLWSRSHVKIAGKPCYFKSLELLPDNRILAGGGVQEFHQVGQYQYYQQRPWFALLDTAGNITHDVLYGPHYMGGGNVFRDKNGGYCHWGAIDSFFYGSSDYPNQPGYIAHLDTNFNMSWVRNFADSFSKVAVWNVKQLKDSSYLAMGSQQRSDVIAQLGWLAKVGKNGNVIWQRTYTSDTIYAGYLVDALEKPDGSFLIVGSNKNHLLPTWRRYDIWLIGIDSNGCEIPGCNIITSVPAVQPGLAEFNFYPNPTHGQFTINVSKKGILVITNLLGREVGSYPVAAGKTGLRLPSGLNAGIYTGRFLTDGSKEQFIVKINYQP